MTLRVSTTKGTQLYNSKDWCLKYEYALATEPKPPMLLCTRTYIFLGLTLIEPCLGIIVLWTTLSLFTLCQVSLRYATVLPTATFARTPYSGQRRSRVRNRNTVFKAFKIYFFPEYTIMTYLGSFLN